jgi:hypothetical protein
MTSAAFHEPCRTGGRCPTSKRTDLSIEKRPASFFTDRFYSVQRTSVLRFLKSSVSIRTETVGSRRLPSGGCSNVRSPHAVRKH